MVVVRARKSKILNPLELKTITSLNESEFESDTLKQTFQVKSIQKLKTKTQTNLDTQIKESKCAPFDDSTTLVKPKQTRLKIRLIQNEELISLKNLRGNILENCSERDFLF